MAQTLCIKCGSELKASSYCQFCQQPLIFACTSCEYITDEKVHPDCRNAEVLAKTTTVSTPTFISTTANQQESTVDKIKQEKIPKVEISSVPSYMKSKQDNDKNDNYNINPFAASTAALQSLMTYWLYMYGIGSKKVLKMTEEWYNTFYKPWLN
jgi:dTDP-D-glucose 4,6-dehydratase